MAKVESHAPLTLPAADAALPLHRRVYAQVRQRILEGQLRPGERLPASRTLACELGVSRTTVVRAFEQLSDEGYVDARVGSGTRVSRTLPAAAAPPDVPGAARDDARVSGFAARALELREGASAVNPFYHGLPYAFSPAFPALDAFPHKLWGRSLQGAWALLGGPQLGYGAALSTGYGPLRDLLARYAQQARGVRCTPEQVFVTGGTQAALAATARVLLRPGDAVWLEDPGHKGAHAVFGAAARAVPVGVGPEGLDVDEGVRLAPDARLAYVTPSHQHPLGVTMTLSRRLRLLEWARRAGAWLVEDDYDSEFRYVGHPIESLQGLDRAGRVIYLMTFSKTLFPALRLGYMVVPPGLVPAFRAYFETAQRSLGLLEQVALHSFIEAGHFARHLRKMRALYAERQRALLAGLGESGAPLRARPTEAGLHLVACPVWPPGAPAVSDAELSRRLLERGVVAPALSSFALRARGEGLLLGFTSTPAELTRALGVTKAVLSEVGSEEVLPDAAR